MATNRTSALELTEVTFNLTGSINATPDDVHSEETMLLHNGQESVSKVGSMLTRIAKTTLLCSGSLIMDAGNNVMALPKFFDYYDLDINKLDIPLIVLSVFCAIQVNLLTRGYAVWQLFSDKENAEKISSILNEVRTTFEKRGVIGKGACGIIAIIAGISGTIVIGGRTFSGSDSVLKSLGIDNEIIRYIIDSYMAFSSITAFCAFSLKIFLRNLSYVADRFGIPEDKDTFIHASITAVLRTIGQTLIANYILRETSNQLGLTQLIGTTATNISSITVSLASVGMFSVSRGVDIYKTAQNKSVGTGSANPNKINGGVGCSEIASFYINVIGLFYIAFYYMLTCSSLLDAEEEIGISTEPRYIDLVNLSLLALGATVVENEFLVEKVRKTVTSFFSTPKKIQSNPVATIEIIEETRVRVESP